MKILMLSEKLILTKIRMIHRSQKFIFLADHNSTRSKIIKKQLEFGRSKIVDLSPIITQTNLPQQNQIQIFNPALNQYQNVVKDHNGIYSVSSELVQQEVILFRLHLFTQLDEELSSYPPKIPLQITKDVKNRDRTRTIKQVIEFVRAWRRLVREKGNGYSYQDAANALGISKKSLDDYYYQLRVGEKYEFDFEGNMDENIKILRNFVRQNNPQRSQKGSKHQKLPKTLKMFQEQQNIGQVRPKIQNQNIKPKAEDKGRGEDMMVNGGHQSQSRDRHISDSQISSMQPIWFLNNAGNNSLEDEDSFFRKFQRDDQDFVQFGHLM